MPGDALVLPDQESYQPHETVLSSGLVVAARLGQPGDRARLIDGFAKLSERSRYLRFFTPLDQLPGPVADQLSDVDPLNRVAIIARDVANSTEDGPYIGVSRYFRDPHDPSMAEVSFTVLDEYQGMGVGSFLYDEIANLARRQGIERFVAEVLAENTAMLALFTRRGAEIDVDPDDGVVLHVTIRL